jgi:hypothetical protein
MYMTVEYSDSLKLSRGGLLVHAQSVQMVESALFAKELNFPVVVASKTLEYNLGRTIENRSSGMRPNPWDFVHIFANTFLGEPEESCIFVVLSAVVGGCPFRQTSSFRRTVAHDLSTLPSRDQQLNYDRKP